MPTDSIAEFGFGEGAIILKGRVALSEHGPIKKGEAAHKILLVGVVAAPIAILGQGWKERWDTKIILIPRRKFKVKIGWLAEDLIREGLAQDDLWGKPYWEVTDGI